MGNKTDPLDYEISVSGELTERGVKASAKARAVAGFDRLLGNVIDRFNLPLEEHNTIKRAELAGKEMILDAAYKTIAKEIIDDASFAKRVLQGHLSSLSSRQANKDKVVHVALEDLSAVPPSDGQATTGPEVLSDEFMDRFERYAEDASTDDLREKWGRVLAAEVRSPGTISRKVMRAVDELDGDTALVFERLCMSRIGDTVPSCLAANLDFKEQARLLEAGLVSDVGLGVVQTARSTTTNNGIDAFIIRFGNLAIFIPKAEWRAGQYMAPFGPSSEVLVLNDSEPAVPTQPLTEVGVAIAQILPDRQDAALYSLLEKVRERIPSAKAYRGVGDTMKEYDPQTSN